MRITHLKIILLAIITVVCTAVFVSCDRDVEQETFRLTYMAGYGGQISGLSEQEVEKSMDGEAVTAIANEGFKFVKWSDGITTAHRQDKNVYQDIEVQAEFSEAFSLKYTASAGGNVQGNTNQTVCKEGNGTTVTAVPNRGYVFMGWSDGVQTASRQDKKVIANLDVQAIFKVFTYSLNYVASEGGYIVGEASQEIEPGHDGAPVKAVAYEGYEFANWWDSNKNPERQDLNIKDNISMTAYFAHINVTFRYFPDHGGTIVGNTTQKLYANEYGEEVTAVPDEGYLFVGWTDGVTTQKRTDKSLESISVRALFAEAIEVRYIADVGGIIVGKAEQTIPKGRNTEKVTAVPCDGYVFVDWSDLLRTEERYETEVSKSKTLIAYFEPIEKKFSFEYNGATSGTAVSCVTVLRDTPKASAFPIPEKEGFVFGGWYADENFTIKVVNENGILMYGYQTVALESEKLYARWIVPSDEVIYKILVVVVDEIDAILKSEDQSLVDVKYKLTSIERKIFSQYANRISQYLNEWFKGEVVFEIDTYYTLDPIQSNDFTVASYGSMGGVEYFIRGDKVNELKEIYNPYGSMLCVFNMGDYDNLLHHAQGITGWHVASIHAEGLFRSLIYNDVPLYDILTQVGSAGRNWDDFIDTGIHEFIHSIEQYYPSVGFYNLHTAIRDVGNSQLQYGMLEVYRLFLLNELDLDGTLRGIPKSFWTEGGTYNKDGTLK